MYGFVGLTKTNGLERSLGVKTEYQRERERETCGWIKEDRRDKGEIDREVEG